MNITTDFKRDYAAALRNMHVTESEIARHTERLASTEGLTPGLLAEAHFDGIIRERQQRVDAKVRESVRRLICGTCMVAPISAVLTGAIWYVTI